MATESAKKITLRSSDGEFFVVPEAVARESQTLKSVIEDDVADSVIPLPNISGSILAKVILYCKRHLEGRDSKAEAGDGDVEGRGVDEELEMFDAEFVEVDQAILINILMAANYLHIENLLDLTCQTVANMMRGRSPGEIRDTFNIENDYNPQEEEDIRKEYAWAFR